MIFSSGLWRSVHPTRLLPFTKTSELVQTVEGQLGDLMKLPEAEPGPAGLVLLSQRRNLSNFDSVLVLDLIQN